MNTQWWYLIGGIVLTLVLYEYQPQLAGWLLLIIVIGFLFNNRKAVGL
jgi:hypothetical protein